MSAEDDRVPELIRQIIRGDTNALAELFAIYRPRLWRMVNFRLDNRLQGRSDADDILQEAWLNSAQRIEHFVTDATRSPFIWFRLVVMQTLVDVHRRHIGTQKRDARREFSIDSGWTSQSTSMSLTYHLLGHLTSPSYAALRHELSLQLDTALAGMNEIDREVLALRHFEELSNKEAAQVLNLTEQAASVRYIRALGRLKHVLEAIPGYDEP